VIRIKNTNKITMSDAAIAETFIEAVKKGVIIDVKPLIGQVGNVDSPGTEGMTALMYASYKGNKEMVEYLLANGADPNCDSQKDMYTPLMFAALSGSVNTVRILLEAGANPRAENKIKRTASQLGAFVGRHDCVSIINNFVEPDQIKYHTETHGLEDTPKLPDHLSSALHQMIVIPNLNPVKLVLFLQDHVELLENQKSVTSVLECECSKAFKAVNEVLSIKVHVFHHVYQQAVESYMKNKEIKTFLKFLVKVRKEDGFPINQEMLLRGSLKTFQFASQSNLFQQIIKSVWAVEPGQSPSTLTCLTQSINGMQSTDFSECCSCCGERHCLKKCSACKMVRYCSGDCQKLHWPNHKLFCKQLKVHYDEKQKQEKQEELEKDLAKVNAEEDKKIEEIA